MEPKDVLHATPYELWKRAEAWESNARDAQKEVAQLTRQFAEAKAELRSHKAAMAGMQNELFGAFNRKKALWKAEVLEQIAEDLITKHETSAYSMALILEAVELRQRAEEEL